MITLQRAETIIARFQRQRILVFGDLMLDRYIYGNVERISPEAPVPVVRINREKSMPGGAANVAANIRVLGGHVDLAGIVGDDAAGTDLIAAARGMRIDTEGILRLAGHLTTVKMRVIAERQQVVRVDWEVLPRAEARLRCDWVTRLLPRVKAATGVIMADYGKGVLEADTVIPLQAAARRWRKPLGVDPKDTHVLPFCGITLATPNCREAHVCAGVTARSSIGGDPARDERLRRVAAILMRKWRPEQLLITLGAQGMYLVGRKCAPEVIPTQAREVFDVSGAGDTVIATCLLALTAGATRREAAMLGNCAAGVVVGKLGTACCTPEELLAAVARSQRK